MSALVAKLGGDAPWGAYVDHAIPPGAWAPGAAAKTRGQAA